MLFSTKFSFYLEYLNYFLLCNYRWSERPISRDKFK